LSDVQHTTSHIVRSTPEGYFSWKSVRTIFSAYSYTYIALVRL
jgi:hypothetical protein